MLILYTLTIFLGAALLFLVQPLVGRLVLPLLGGSPAVWNTAMVFYQAALLAGYAYAHGTTRWLGVKRQVVLHLAILLLPLAVLPIALPVGWTPPTGANPVPWLLLLLATMAGLPFFVVAATSPLLQRWFAASGQRTASDPYFLYAASNAGSLLALVVYPILIEPRLRLGEQSGWWAAGYGLLVVLVAGCGLWVRRTATELPVTVATSSPVSRRQRFRWVLLAFVPCSLMLSVTTHITSELAPIPLLWVVPLGLYLLSFIFVFARRQVLPRQWLRSAMPVTVIGVVMALTGRLLRPLEWLLALHLLNLFVVAMVCHGQLADERPAAHHLTEFYLWTSVGGVLGGMFNSLLAPVLFRTIVEYPFTLIMACWLMWRPRAFGTRDWLREVAGLLLVGAVSALLNRWRIPLPWMLGIPAVLCLCWWRRPFGFGVAVAAVIVAGVWVPGFQDLTLLNERSFFGVHRVGLAPDGRFHFLAHGNTIHGVQSLEPGHEREPLAYFSRTGPFGQAFAALPAGVKQRVGVIGLGTGTLASYAELGQQWTFFEIDPVVERLARNPEYFTFLPSCRGKVAVRLGDARLSLQQVPDDHFGTLVLDAYSSDTVPLHLITREALALYRQKTAANGVLLFHISNRHLRLEGVLGALAQDARLVCLAQSESNGGTAQLLVTGKIGSKWVVMARDLSVLGLLNRDPRWSAPPARLRTPVWTDDYASVFSVFHWR
jgi:hypothetical protein